MISLFSLGYGKKKNPIHTFTLHYDKFFFSYLNDIVTSDGIRIFYTGKFQDFPPRYMINRSTSHRTLYCQLIYLYTLVAEILCENVNLIFFFHIKC